MFVEMESKAGSNKTPCPHVQEAAASPSSTAVNNCNGKSIPQDIQVSHSGTYSDILSVLEQLISQGIRNYFNNPQNMSIVSEYLTHQKDHKKPQHSCVARDISYNEILRPRDLPQATGLSRTNIWRLERAGLFVKKLKLSAGAVGYRAADVREWVANRQISLGEKP